MKTEFVAPGKFASDLSNFYINQYLIKELRDFYTNKEKETFYKSTHHTAETVRPRTQCKKHWPICYTSLEIAKHHPEKAYSTFKCQFVLSNFKFDHFSKLRPRQTSFKSPVISQPSPSESPVGKILEQEDDLMIERQRHVCSCYDEGYEKMKSEVRSAILKQMSLNSLLAKGKNIKRSFEPEVQEAYKEFKKKATTNFYDNESDRSMSSPHTISRGIRNVHDSCNYVM